MVHHILLSLVVDSMRGMFPDHVLALLENPVFISIEFAAFLLQEL